MSMSHTAEFWHDVKNNVKQKIRRGGTGFMHAKGIRCGHNHPVESQFREDVTCPACLKLITSGATILTKAEFTRNRIEDITCLDESFEVEEVGPLHYRIKGSIDLFPNKTTYENSRTGCKGQYPWRNLEFFLHKELQLPAAVFCDCGARMVERVNRSSGSKFFGCTRFPKCRNTKSVII